MKGDCEARDASAPRAAPPAAPDPFRGGSRSAPELVRQKGALLDTLLRVLPGVGDRRAQFLEKLSLRTVRDLIRHLPRRYEDRRHLTPIASAAPGGPQVLYGEVARVRERSSRGGKHLLEVRLVDASSPRASTGGIDLVWFNQPYLLEWLRPGMRMYVYGPVKAHSGKLQVVAPEFEIDSGSEPEEETSATAGASASPPASGSAAATQNSPHIQRIVPIYPLTKGVSQRFLRALVFRTLENLEDEDGPFDHFHPGKVGWADACRSLHFPRDRRSLDLARSRFVFEEEFAFASHLFFRRQACRQGGAPRFNVTDELDRKIRSVFPFQLTLEQNRAVEEITRDLRGPTAMYRLLQGDVGTGKTAVALYALLVAVRHGHQAALMAPTEVLAEQHHRTISAALAGHPVGVVLLTGSLRGDRRRRALEAMASGKAHIIVGTHALIQDAVAYRRLGLTVIDEQHRFGVLERMKIRKKGESPHVLVMTATPIPRSLCLTCYGDLDLSIIRRRPLGRPTVKTVIVGPRRRPSALEFVRNELRAGRQAYFVYPLIEESEALALPAAVKARETLARDVFPEFRVGLVHGSLAPAEKDAELEKFRRRETHVLVATVVVEVGIDVPNASVLCIEDASRFGLAQLHQLRGRVGRGTHPGYCLVALGSSSKEALARLKVFASTEDGFRIAEEDLKLRGPGDYVGLRQSGRPHFLIGNPLENLAQFLEVKEIAERFWKDPAHKSYLKKWAEALDLGESRDPFVGFD